MTNREAGCDYEEISKKRSEAQSKEVTQYDFDGRIVAIWRNAYVSEEHGYNRTMINQCCLGNKKSHKGYVWKYTNNIEKQAPKKPTDNTEREWFECPTCGRVIVTYYAGERHHCKCGQALNWEGIK